MEETMLVRLKPYDPRRGQVLQRYTYLGIKFHQERGWYRVDSAVADYVRGVHQVPGSDYTPLAFDVCTDEEAKARDAREDDDAKVKRAAADDPRLSVARDQQLPSAMTTASLGRRPVPEPASPAGPATPFAAPAGVPTSAVVAPLQVGAPAAVAAPQAGPTQPTSGAVAPAVPPTPAAPDASPAPTPAPPDPIPKTKKQ